MRSGVPVTDYLTKQLFIIPNDAHNYKITRMLKTIKILKFLTFL
jgi:hypothetical protein